MVGMGSLAKRLYHERLRGNPSSISSSLWGEIYPNQHRTDTYFYTSILSSLERVCVSFLKKKIVQEFLSSFPPLHPLKKKSPKPLLSIRLIHITMRHTTSSQCNVI